MKRWFSGVVMVVVACGLMACTDSGDSDRPQDQRAFPTLEKAWEIDVDSRLGARPLVRSDGLVLALVGNQAVAWDDATGEQAWSTKLPNICTVTPDVHRGRLVISRSPTPSQECQELLTLEVATGQVGWRRTTRGSLGTGFAEDLRADFIAVGDKVVSARQPVCGGVVRYRLADGKQLKSIAPMGHDSLACDDFAVADGWIAHVSTDDNQRSRQFRLIDADSGKVMFSRPSGALELHNIVSTQPLIMDLTRAGHRLAWEVDPVTGTLGTPYGWQRQTWLDEDRLDFQVHGDVLALNKFSHTPWEAGSQFDGFSPTGDLVWSGFPTMGTYVGDDGRGAIVVTHRLAESDDEPKVAVTRHSWSDVDDVVVLGTLPSQHPFGISGYGLTAFGDLLIDARDAVLVAYRLPETGLEAALPPLAPDPFTATVPEEAWAPDDVRPNNAPTCAVSDEALATFGFHQLDLPDPIGCTWRETEEPRNFTRDLTIGVSVSSPEPTTDQSAVEVAAQELDVLRSDRWPGLSPLDVDAEVHELSGVGDEAVVTEAMGVGGRVGRVGIAVRVRNVVVWSMMSAQVRKGQSAGMAAPHLYGPALLSVVTAIFNAAGLEVNPPEVTTRVAPTLRENTNLCAALAEQVAELVPGVKGREFRPDEQRAVGCGWSELAGGYTSAQVGLVRVPASALTGRSAVDMATSGFDGVRDSPEVVGRPIRVSGLGDEAWAWTADTWFSRSPGGGSPARWTAALVMVRQGNLTLAVQLQLKDTDHVVVREHAVALARAALATQRGA